MSTSTQWIVSRMVRWAATWFTSWKGNKDSNPKQLAAFNWLAKANQAPRRGSWDESQEKEHSEGNKLTFDVEEDVLVQDLKTWKWDTKGTITEVRVVNDGTVSSYDLMIGDLPTTRHRRYLAKLKNAREADSGEKDKGGAPTRFGSQL